MRDDDNTGDMNGKENVEGVILLRCLQRKFLDC